MIYPDRITEHDIPQIWSQITYLLPQETLLLMWPPLFINQISFLLKILIHSMLWRIVYFSKVGWTEDTAVVNMVKEDATKIQGYISPHDLIRTRNLLFLWVIQNYFRDKYLLLGTSILYVASFHFFVVLVSLSSFNLHVRIVLCLFSSCSIDHSLQYTVCLLWLIIWYCIVFLNFLNACDDSPVRQLICTGHFHAYYRLLKKGMTWCKKLSHRLPNLLTVITNKIIVLKYIFMLLTYFDYFHNEYFNNFFNWWYFVKYSMQCKHSRNIY